MTNGIYENKPAYLLTGDGTVYSGFAFGFIPEKNSPVIGELVFTTQASGYTDTLTDPQNYGQIVIQAFPLIGNYGIITSDTANKIPALSAYIVRDYCQAPSNFRSEGTLDIFLCSNRIPGLAGIDTRALIRRVRDNGPMNGVITYEKPDIEKYAQMLEDFRIENAVANTALHAGENQSGMRKFTPEDGAGGTSLYKIALWDFGTGRNIVPYLLGRGCEITEFPCNAKAEDILNEGFDGIVLSSGAGDPAENTGIIKELGKICESGVPVFGVSLGHQMTAIAMGAQTEKMKCGHRGANQPVRRNSDGRIFITQQNHGYTVVPSSVPENAEISFVNINDGTCEGIEYKNKPVFTVQFIPDESGSPGDTGCLYDKFIAEIDKIKGRNI